MSARIYILVAPEDDFLYDKFVAEASGARVEARFSRIGSKSPWVPTWKGQCRTRIRECDGMIVLITRKTNGSVGSSWEFQCAAEADLPLLGVYGDRFDKGAVPAELAGHPVVEWNWAEIGQFVRSLGKAQSGWAPPG
jgi:hypothetical protein